MNEYEDVRKLMASARIGWRTFQRVLKNRLDEGEKAVPLSILAWKAKVNLLRDGYLDIPVGVESCPLCLSNTPPDGGGPDCRECSLFKFYGYDCDATTSTYNRLSRALSSARAGALGIDEVVKRAEDMLADLQKVQDQMEQEYFELALADLTDDVDCSSYATVSRPNRMAEIAKIIGENTADKLDLQAQEQAERDGYYCSGAPFNAKEQQMKTKLTYTPISGKGVDEIILDHKPDLQPGFYRLEGATASIRVMHEATVQSLYDAINDRTCVPINICGDMLNVTANVMMSMISAISREHEADAIRLIQRKFLPDCSTLNAKQICKILRQDW